MAGVGGGGSNYTQLNQQNIPGFGPNTGGGLRETREERTQRLESEERNKEVLDDPYGLRRPEGNRNTTQTTRVVRKKVRVKRNNGQAENSGSTQSAGRNRGTAKGAQAGPNSLLNRTMNGQSSLVRASVLFKNNQAQNSQQANNTNVAVRNKMLNGLNSYIKNDYSMMKLNPDDKAFTYRTAEARQLGATIGQMVASTSRASGGKDKKAPGESDSGSNNLTPAAYGRKKGLLRRLAAMSEPNPKLPDDLPVDYKPFEDVA